MWYSHVIVDEVQDFGRAGLTLIANLAGSGVRDPQVFMVGDQNQRISGEKAFGLWVEHPGACEAPQEKLPDLFRDFFPFSCRSQ